MSVRLNDNVIHLDGGCGIADVEPLLALLQSPPGRTVDLSDAGHLHAAVFQLLLAFRPPCTGLSADPFLATWLMPALMEAQKGQGSALDSWGRGPQTPISVAPLFLTGLDLASPRPCRVS